MTNLNKKIDKYFSLMEEIREALFRVVEVSERYLCIVSFSTQYQAVMVSLVNKESLMEVKLLSGLTGAEIIAYGKLYKAVEDWQAGGMKAAFPIDQDADVYTRYRKLVAGDQPEPVKTAEPVTRPTAKSTKKKKLDRQTQDNVRTEILSADRQWLIYTATDLKLITRKRAVNTSDEELQNILIAHACEAEKDDKDEPCGCDPLGCICWTR